MQSVQLFNFENTPTTNLYTWWSLYNTLFSITNNAQLSKTLCQQLKELASEQFLTLKEIFSCLTKDQGCCFATSLNALLNNQEEKTFFISSLLKKDQNEDIVHLISLFSHLESSTFTDLAKFFANHSAENFKIWIEIFFYFFNKPNHENFEQIAILIILIEKNKQNSSNFFSTISALPRLSSIAIITILSRLSHRNAQALASILAHLPQNQCFALIEKLSYLPPDTCASVVFSINELSFKNSISWINIFLHPPTNKTPTSSQDNDRKPLIFSFFSSLSKQELSSFTSTLQPCSSDPTIQEVFAYFIMYQKSVNQNVGCEITSKTTKLATQIFQTSQQNINYDPKQQDDLIKEMGLATSVKNILKQDDAPSGDVHFPSMQQRTSWIFRKRSKIDQTQREALIKQMRNNVSVKELSKQKNAPSISALFELKNKEGLTKNYKPMIKINQTQQQALVQKMLDNVSVKELLKQDGAPSMSTLHRLKKEAGLTRNYKPIIKINQTQQQALVQKILGNVPVKELLKQDDAPSISTLRRLKKKAGLTRNYKPIIKINQTQRDALIQQIRNDVPVKELLKQDGAPSITILRRLKKEALVQTSWILRKRSKFDPKQKDALAWKMREGVTIEELLKQKDAPCRTFLFQLRNELGLTRNYKQKIKIDPKQNEALVQKKNS